MKPAQAIRYIQIKPAVPPLTSAMMEVLPSVSSIHNPGKYYATTDPNAVSQVAIRIMENPKMETNRKFRYAQQLAIQPCLARLVVKWPYSQFLSFSHTIHIPLILGRTLLLRCDMLIEGAFFVSSKLGDSTVFLCLFHCQMSWINLLLELSRAVAGTQKTGRG
jgi:hypothetical protein